MNKELYSTPDWVYDCPAYRAIMFLSEKHDHAVPIFAWAVDVYGKSLPEIIEHIPDVVREVRFYGWHTGIVGAIHTYLHICNVDPMLVEAYLGARIDQLF